MRLLGIMLACMYAAAMLFAAFFYDGDFELARVPASSGTAIWTPPPVLGGWQFSAGSGLGTTVPGQTRRPPAEDGTQIAILRGAQATLTQGIGGWESGVVYHLRWSEVRRPAPSSGELLLTLRGGNGSVLSGIVVHTLGSSNGWQRQEAVFVAHEPAYFVTFTHNGANANTATFLDRVRLWREPATPPNGFPRFMVPGHEREMTLLRELFFTHYSSVRVLGSFNMHWVTESVMWPALASHNGLSQRDWTRDMLAARKLDADGYVSCHQHPGLGHLDGWPFPAWWQSGGFGWHFRPHVVPMFSPWLTNASLCSTRGVDTLQCDTVGGWQARITAPTATIEFPPMAVRTMVSSFIILEWSLQNPRPKTACFLEWRSAAHPEYCAQQRMALPLPAPGIVNCEWIELLRHPLWLTNDTLTGVRLVFEHARDATIGLYSISSAVDTRHNVNNAMYIDACYSYAAWSGDTNFLQQIMPRLRTAMRYALDEFAVLSNACVLTPWLGHDGTSGLAFDARGVKSVRYGYGIGNNYWDLLPFGGRDTCATLYLFNALRRLAALETQVARQPQWRIPAPPAALAPMALLRIADTLAAHATQFWNTATERFVAAVDVNGVAHDYGYTFVNCEAVHYDFASPQQAEQIMQWLEGSRTVAGDTAQGADIYHWAFAPRASTRRNVDYYTYVWSGPESLPFGGQVQDGGAVLGFSYHDLMTRLRTRGADNAWQRLREILAWFARVQAEGGYREYYYNSTVATRGTLQGGGTAGGLGLDCEFFENVLVPQVMLYGFMGARPRLDGLVLRPQLPGTWPSLTITDVRLHDSTLHLKATKNSIAVRIADGTADLRLFPPPGTWEVAYYAKGRTQPDCRSVVTINRDNPGVPLRMNGSVVTICTRSGAWQP
jgi:hypothetical protein